MQPLLVLMRSRQNDDAPIPFFICVYLCPSAVKKSSYHFGKMKNPGHLSVNRGLLIISVAGDYAETTSSSSSSTSASSTTGSGSSTVNSNSESRW